MKLIDKWNKMLSSSTIPKAFWDEYLAVETDFYRDVLANKPDNFKMKLDTRIEELMEKYDLDDVTAVGLIDGINESLTSPLDLENLEENSEIHTEVDLKLLYQNMIRAKAEWLYGLEEWDEILSDSDKRQIRAEYVDSITAKSQKTVGRNDPCTCGSGKKYKKCCALKDIAGDDSNQNTKQAGLSGASKIANTEANDKFDHSNISDQAPDTPFIENPAIGGRTKSRDRG